MNEVSGETKDNEGREKQSPFACFRCGFCCTYYQVRVTSVEAQIIAEKLGICWERFLDEYVERSWGPESYLIGQRDGSCVFLEQSPDGKQANCSIHSIKPADCKNWVPGLNRRECQKGLTKYWGLEVGSGRELIGTKENIESFRQFLRTLDEI